MMNLDEIKTAIHSHNKGSFTTIETCKTASYTCISHEPR
jgi:hypothetical protein